MNLGAARTLAGPRVLAYSFSVIPISVAAGAVELLLGFSIYACLVQFRLLMPDRQPGALSALHGVDPVVALLVLGAAAAVLRYLNQFLPEKSGELLSHRVRTRIAESLLSGYRERLHLSTQQVAQLLGTLLPNAGGFFNAAGQLLGAALLMLVLLAGMMRLSAILTGFALLAMVLFAVPFAIARPLAQRFAGHVHAERSRFMKKAVADAQNVYFLKISGASERELEELRTVSARISHNYQLHAACAALSGGLPQFMAILLVVAILLANQWRPLLPVGELVAFIYILSRVANGVAQAAAAATNVQFTWPFVTDLLAMIGGLFAAGRKETEAAGTHRIDKVSGIDVRGLAVGRERPLMRDLGFSVRPGEILVVSGPSGRGKSTLLMTLLGVLPPLAGEVLWSGIAVDQLDPAALRAFVGYAGAEPFLFNGTVRENLMLGAPAKVGDPATLDRAVRAAHAGFVYDLPGALDHVLREGGEGISGGQKQRIALARALLRRPDVLILDEALANVDEATEARIMASLKQEFPGMIVIMVSHRSSVLGYATNVVAIDAGFQVEATA